MLQPKGEFLWAVFIPTCILLGISGWFVYRNIRLMLQSTRVEGTVIGYESFRGANARISYAQKAQFTTKEGVERIVTSNVHSSPPSHNVGDRVPVYYTNVPEAASIGTFSQLWLVPLILGVIGGILGIIWFGTWVGPPDSGFEHASTQKTRSS